MTQNEENGRYQMGRWILREDWLIWILIVGCLLAGIVIYPSMPERMPIHYSSNGQVDGWGSRFIGVFLIPLITLGLYVLLLLLPLLDPKGKNYARFAPTFRILRLLIVVVMVLIWVVAMAAVVDQRISVGVVVPLALSGMLIVLGNFMGRVKPNWFIGIRTPWTLSNEEVWRRTHRVGGRSMVLGGIIGLGSGFFQGSLASLIFRVAFLGSCLFPVVYSFVIWKQLNKRQGTNPANEAKS